MEKEITCLLIDDDEDDQEIFAFAAQRTGHPVNLLTAKGGLEALNKFSADPAFTPDFIFLDLNMPLMHGKECLQELRKLKRLNDVPVIIYSTSGEERDINETKYLGATDFITKQTSIEVLARLLMNVFGKNPL